MSHEGYQERAWRRGGSKPCPGSPRTIEVLVETLTGSAFEMTVSPLDTVLAIKSKIYRVEGIPVSQQHLLYKLKELEDCASLQDQQVCDGASLRLVVSMRGGPISMHRLQPPSDAHWRRTKHDIDSDGKVNVLLVWNRSNVNMLRVSEDDAACSAVRQLNNNRAVRRQEAECDETRAENRLTASKMATLRRRMQALGVNSTRHSREDLDEASCMHKTRSEESLPSPAPEPLPSTSRFVPAPPLAPPLAVSAHLDGAYTRYEYECSFADRYTLLPPISADSEQSSGEDEHVSLSGERIKLSDALAGSILVKRGAEGGAAGEGGGGARADEVLAHTALSATQYGPLVGCELSPTWRARGFGSSSQLAPALSASPPAPPLGEPPLSSSTSDLETLKRHRPLPALCRHRNRENLDLSDERLDTPAKHCLEVGSERRHRRIRKIAELQRAEASTYCLDGGYESVIRKLPNNPPPPPPDVTPDTPPPKKNKVRCGFCKKRLSISTVHQCRCGGEYCAPHRYAEVHGCAYDYKAQAHQYLQRANPLVSAPKLPKI